MTTTMSLPYYVKQQIQLPDLKILLTLNSDHEMSTASMYRIIYLTLKEYHNSLSQHLSEHGISLPDLDTLVSDP